MTIRLTNEYLLRYREENPDTGINLYIGVDEVSGQVIRVRYSSKLDVPAVSVIADPDEPDALGILTVEDVTSGYVGCPKESLFIESIAVGMNSITYGVLYDYVDPDTEIFMVNPADGKLLMSNGVIEDLGLHIEAGPVTLRFKEGFD